MNKPKIANICYVEDNKVNSEVWGKITPLVIENFPWDENGYRPRTEVFIFYTDTKLHLQFKAYEKEIRAECLNMNDPVCTDSCVEFFFNPDPENDERYMNFEINPIGTLLLGIGKDRHSRTQITGISPKMFNIVSSVAKESIKSYNGPLWSIKYSIPFTFIERFYGKQSFSAGKMMKANFYKCGDKTKYPHFGCWNLIENPIPDFHRPKFFGELILK